MQSNKLCLTFKINIFLGLRSGEVTPGGSIGLNGSRPGSAMSTSICGNVISRRTTPRKPRPVSIAGTGVTVSGMIL